MKKIITLVLILHCGFLTAQNKKQVDSLSFTSLKLEIYDSNSLLGTATGFVIQKNDKNYLVTNLHVLTGVDYYSHVNTDTLKRTPMIVGIWHNSQILGNWLRVPEALYNRNGTKRWIECSDSTGKVFDLIALPLTNKNKAIKIYPLQLNAFRDDMSIVPGFPASIIGFPYGMASFGRFAIWKTGHIASDMDIDADDLPVLMIDATTKPGMSGSIVIVRQANYVNNKGTTIMGSIGTAFIGVYSAQSSQEEIGYVWKPVALKKLIDKLP